MASVFLTDPNNVLLNKMSIAPQTLVAIATTNGTGVDFNNTEGAGHALITTGDCGDATLTLTVKLQESLDDAATDPYTDITGATVGYAGATLADNLNVWISAHSKTKRWVRAVVTLAGGGALSVPISVSLHATLKEIGTGNGAYTGF